MCLLVGEPASVPALNEEPAMLGGSFQVWFSACEGPLSGLMVSTLSRVA